MSRPVAVVFCPGRGSYGATELGTLARLVRPGEVADALALADDARASAGEPTVSELDAAEKFRPSVHLEGRNASELIYFATLAHLEHVRDQYDVAAVVGNSLGWYTALAGAGALSVADGWRLVRSMSTHQQSIAGGQILTTAIDDDWRVDPERLAEIEQLVDAVSTRGADSFAAFSIRLGGHVVLAGTEAAIARLLDELPKRSAGEREFPFRLAGHGPFHTPLCAPVSELAVRELPELGWRQPHSWLVDGCGSAQSPWSVDPTELCRYTATTQLVQTFDFTAAVRTALREFNPDCCVCLAPGETLRAPVGHVVIAEAFRGVGDRKALFATDLVRTS